MFNFVFFYLQGNYVSFNINSFEYGIIKFVCVVCQFVLVDVFIYFYFVGVDFENLSLGFFVGIWEFNFVIKMVGMQQCRVEDIYFVCGGDDFDVVV